MADYDWKESNLAFFGSEEDKEVKKEAAETEPAWQAVKAIQSKVTMVWRINKFKLEVVPPNEVGQFYSGDSYIILHTDKVGKELIYDAHFWIGKESSQDEYGTAAYKTVELDAFLDDEAVQHREVDGFESEKFKGYFKQFQKLSGGYVSGFNRVKPEDYRPRLLCYHGIDRNHIELTEVTFSRQALDSKDVFILDLGTKAYKWNGSEASKDEKFIALQYLTQLETSRNGRCPGIVVDESDKDANNEFLAFLPDEPVKEIPKQICEKKAIYRLSDAEGKLEFTLICEEVLTRSSLTDDDAYFIDNGESLFVYIGGNCSAKEKKNALAYAHQYLRDTPHPLIPITVVTSKNHSKELEQILT